jgi:hypothetical protein
MMLMAVALWSCDPLCDDESSTDVVSESELQLDVHATTDGGNEIVLINNTPKVGSFWDYGLGYSSAQSDTIIMPYMGTATITFTGMCKGGTVTTTRTINVTKIDHAASKEWAYFAGTGSKKWVWDETVDACYGEGGYLAEMAPSWGEQDAASATEDPSGYMVFDLNGGPNFTRYKGDGTVAEKGKFAFDMSSTLANGDDESQTWAIGKLTLTGATVLNGHIIGSTDPQYTYHILQLDDDHLILCAAPDGAAAWDSGTFWIFQKGITAE